MQKLKVGILGSGNIGTDLLVKVLRSPYLQCGVFIGRNAFSLGIAKAQSMNVPVSCESIEYIIKNPSCCDVVFDATNAKDHVRHAEILRTLKKLTIDLTPAKIGVMCVPAVNLEYSLQQDNVNMVTCGGQAAIPIAYAIGKIHPEIEYIETVSTIASKSAGPATRINLDEYIQTTEEGIRKFSGAKRTKAILNLNPANPCIHMQTTLFAKICNPLMKPLHEEVSKLVTQIQRYVPGYHLVLGPIYENGRIVVTLRVKGLGDYLPEYAGNLDIINCAAVAVAEEYAKKI